MGNSSNVFNFCDHIKPLISLNAKLAQILNNLFKRCPQMADLIFLTLILAICCSLKQKIIIKRSPKVGDGEMSEFKAITPTLSASK